MGDGWILLGAAATATLVSWGLVPVCRRLALRIGLLDQPGLARKGDRPPIPYGGGLAVFATVTGLGLAAWALAAWVAHCEWRPAGYADGSDAWRLAWDRGLAFGRALAYPASLARGAALFGGGAVIFALGLYDDWRPLPARVKLVVQLAVAVAAVLLGCRTGLPEAVLGSSPLAAVAAGGIAVLWIVLVTNAFNLLDNMDGLTGGVAAWASLLFGVVAWQHGQMLLATILMLIFGAALGFLRYNWAPATIYLGDAGALFLGYLLGVLTISTNFYAAPNGLHALATPLCVLAVPLYDSLSVLYIRRRIGKPLFEGDRNHLSHRLVRLGLSRKEAVSAICLLTVITGGLATLLSQVGTGGAAAVFGLMLAVLSLLWLLETAARRRPDGAEPPATPESPR